MPQRLPRAAVLAVAIILAIELIGVPIATHLLWPSLWLHSEPRTDDALRFRAQLKLADPDKRLVYVMGSSQGRQDIGKDLTEQLFAEAGIDDAELWNLAVAGGDAIDAYLQLDAIEEKPPSIVVLVSSWVFFYDEYDPTKLEMYCTSLGRLRELARMYTESAFWNDADGELSSTVLSNLVPSFRWARSYVTRSLLHDALFEEERSEPRWYAAYAHHGEDYYVRTLDEYGRRQNVTVHTLRKRRALEAFAREVLAMGAELVVVEGPVHPRSADLKPAFRIIWEDYITHMRAMSLRLPFTYVEMNACDVADASLFHDFGHLNSEGRRRFTECITRTQLLPRLR